jgi:uncharacterized RDD family membrane protein YckC
MGGVPEQGAEPTEALPAAPAAQEDLLGRRIAAALIDLALLAGLFVVLALTLGESNGQGNDISVIVEEDDTVTTISPSDGDGTSFSLTGADAGLYFALVLLYYFVLEAAIRQTVGKLVLGLQVIRADGTRPSVSAIAVRTLLRIVDWLPAFYLVGFIATLSTGQRRQRLGDLAAKTTVARKQPTA